MAVYKTSSKAYTPGSLACTGLSGACADGNVTKLADSLREAIEEEIATGKLIPGARLEETQLAARFGVSRTPVREVLNLLAGEGLVEARAGRGMVVTEIHFERVVEMFEVMGELEALCARHAARRMSSAELQRLELTHHACAAACEAGDTDAYFYANERFHELIYAGSKNQFLTEQALALHRKLRPYRRLQLRVRNRMLKSFEEHGQIVRALQAGADDEVFDLIRRHVLVQGERFGDLLASLRSVPTAA